MTFGPEEWGAVLLSLQVAGVATLVSLPLAIAVAYLLARKSFPGKQVVNALVHLPLVLPPVVTGYLLLLSFGAQGAIGQILAKVGISFAFNWAGAALAAGVMAFPLMVRAIRLGFEATDPGLEEAATTLGASPWRVFATVTLPLSVNSIIAATVLGFAKALGEFGATITFVASIPGETRTLPSAIYAFLQVPGGEGPALRLTLIAVVIAVGALLVSERVAARAAQR
ncbi:MAG: molybdate ABC transporter permease subunit [Litoreibacter sp.]|nr:molybdate ABC transporter permease subunit [Litoreibacter sp.]